MPITGSATAAAFQQALAASKYSNCKEHLADEDSNRMWCFMAAA
jgi:hypothetical protein